jgi:hypothetical protein
LARTARRERHSGAVTPLKEAGGSAPER